MVASSSNGRTSSASLRIVDDDATASGGLLPDDQGEYNLKILQPMFGYVRAKHGQDTLVDLVLGCGLPAMAVHLRSGWISHEHFERILAAIRNLVGSDEEFMRACVYEGTKQYGAFLLILRCMTVRMTYELMAKTGHMVCKVGRFSTSAATRNSIRVNYTTTRPESRLNCLSRQRQLSQLPTMYLGMAPAKLHEHACVAHGDPRCEYELSWYSPLRVRLLAIGAAAGLLAALGLPEGWMDPRVAYALLPLLGGMTGGMLELRRLLAEHLRFADETAVEVEKVLAAHAQATDELTSLQERERDWNRYLEEGVEARTRKLNEVVRRLQAALRHRSGAAQAALETSSERDALPPRLASMENAVDRVSRLVGELASIARDDATKQDLAPEQVSVDDLVAQIRRQLKATMIGRKVRVTVFQTREAPASLTTIRPVLERVIDNVLFNASRSTDRGSIVVEAGGTPGSLLLKLSDTGIGISKERLEQVFGNDEGPNALAHDRSGLGYAARLLDHIGGRLEIMSEPDVGTTLWIYVPVEYEASTGHGSAHPSHDGHDGDDGSHAVGKVFTFAPTRGPGGATL